MLTQEQANRLIEMLKEAVRKELLVWEADKRCDEELISVEDSKIQFVLSIKHNPFEIRLHLRTRDRDIGLIRVDNSRYHPNPDGTEIINQPHMHTYKEGQELSWAEPIDWYDVSNPLGTLERFLEIIRTRFPAGYQLGMF